MKQYDTFFKNFGALPGTLFIYFCNFLSTVLIQYSSLVMGWYACCCAGFSCCCAGKNLLRYFSAPGFSWAEPREGCRAGFKPGTAVHQPDALTPKNLTWLNRSESELLKMHALLNWAIALSDVRTLFYDNSLIALHSFSFAQKIRDHSSLLSVRSIHKSDVPSSVYAYEMCFYLTA